MSFLASLRDPTKLPVVTDRHRRPWQADPIDAGGEFDYLVEGARDANEFVQGYCADLIEARLTGWSPCSARAN